MNICFIRLDTCTATLRLRGLGHLKYSQNKRQKSSQSYKLILREGMEKGMNMHTVVDGAESMSGRQRRGATHTTDG